MWKNKWKSGKLFILKLELVSDNSMIMVVFGVVFHMGAEVWKNRGGRVRVKCMEN